MEPITWYGEPKYWPFILIIVNAWRVVGYNCIIYLATIIGFDRSYYEAAIVDGASKRQVSITLPCWNYYYHANIAHRKNFYSDSVYSKFIESGAYIY